MDTPKRGRIIWGDFVDPQGNKPGPHRAIIITSDEDLKAGKPIRVVVISSRLDMAEKKDMVVLPYRPVHGHFQTRLKKECAAMCRWLEVIEKCDITRYDGKIYGKWLEDILKRVEELDKEALDQSSTQS